MSEYSYYEFQAIDRPLTEAERRELRSFSSRATITSTRFTNHYEWGYFKGNPAEWMEKYFDAHLYMANWRTRELSLRLPKRLLDPKLARQYGCSDLTSVRVKGDFVILDFLCEDGEWDDYSDDGSGWLSSLIPLRADLVAGDHRALYLAWLLCVQIGGVDEHAEEPPVPAGLGELTPPLDAFAELFEIDGDLIAAAAAASPRAQAAPSDLERQSWIAQLPDAEKTRWLVRLAGGREAHLRAELVRELEKTRPAGSSARAKLPRTVAKIRAAASKLAEERRRNEAERAAAERGRREREAAEARERHLANLGKREADAWRRVDALIATKQPGRYDEAVTLLLDLREIGVRKGQAGEVEGRLRRVWEEHARKPSLLERLRKAGLG